MKEKNYRYSEIQLQQVSGFDPGYKEYCNLNLNSNYELNAVKCSFYGDYENALDQSTRRESISGDPLENISMGSENKADLIKLLETTIQHPDVDPADKAYTHKFLEILNAPAVDEIFADLKPVPAIDYIIEEARKYHFTLINEAHYNSQHRSFTSDLLEPLWDLGYRYLALETLSHSDITIYERGYPNQSTGYYTKDSNFGNLVRKALKMGYQLVPYESQNGHDGTLRDFDQAKNIYNYTWVRDKTGKVLVHAGYSHISEMGDSNYEPMGLQLKNLSQQDILTIDQVTMTGLLDTNKEHQYYQEAIKRFGLSEPTIFLSEEGNVIIDPVISSSIDLQVYHPRTKFENGRPDWMKKEDTKQIPLNKGLLEYKGNLIQAIKSGEDLDAIPVDQFTISEGKVFLLPSSNYDLRVINCMGDRVATVKLEVN